MSTELAALQAKTERVIESHILPHAAQVDREYRWPREAMGALGVEGLLGLQVPVAQGGHGQGLLALSLLTEMIGRSCPSSALCFGMHCVGTAVIAAKATPFHQDKYLRPIARGEHITSLALSESGTGAHFYVPEATVRTNGSDFILNGTKQFITNGGQAHSYVVSTAATGDEAEIGDFSCLVVDHTTSGMEWLEPWRGFGMRGNSSRGVRFTDAPVPQTNLLGEKGDQVWFVFEVVAPYFLMAMAGTYLGIAQSALDAASEHLRSRQYSHSDEALADVNTLQRRFAQMWISIEKTRSLIREAATRGDLGHPDTLPFILACKADAGETAVQVTNDAMTICGGKAYGENSRVGQMLRDARASHVMAPTTDILMDWTGRSLLGRPLL